jgi:hypothetical protein
MRATRGAITQESMARVSVQPALLQWARDRSGLPADIVHSKFPKLSEWESGDTQPTLKQLESFARVTRTPLGMFFLKAPPIYRFRFPTSARRAMAPWRRQAPNC